MFIKNIFRISFGNQNFPYVFTNKRKAIRTALVMAKNANQAVFIQIKNSRRKGFQEYLMVRPNGFILEAYSGGGFLCSENYKY